MPTSRPSEIREGEFVVLIAMMMALQPFAIDSMLPALGDIARDLDVSDPNRRQLVVGLYLTGSGLGALIPGALADRYGRRPVLLTCLISNLILTLGCALVTSFDALLALRFLIGFTSSGLMVMPSAIIRDRIEGDRMARMQSMVAIIFMMVPMIAPAVGQLILLVASWRWIFGAMAIQSFLVLAWVFLRLPESLHAEYRQPIRPGVIFGNMRDVLLTREAFGYVMAPALMMAAMFAYINSSQQLLVEHFGVGKAFPVIFAAMALLMMFASFTNSRIVERFGARRVGHTALLFFIVFAALQLVLASRPHQTVWEFLPVMAATAAMLGFMGGNFNSIALQPFARIAGAASSVQGFIRMVFASLAGILVGQAYDGTAWPIAVAQVIAGLLTLALILFSEKGRLFRRVYPRGVPRPEFEKQLPPT